MFDLLISTNLIITLSSILPILTLGVFVYLRADTTKTYRWVFLLASISISMWALTNYFSLNTGSDFLLTWVRLVMFFAIMEQFLFYLLIHILVIEKFKLKDKKIWILSILAIVGMVVTLTPYVFKEISIKDNITTPLAGPLMPVFAIAIFTFFVIGGIEIIKGIKNKKKEEKIQYIYIAIGYFVMFTLLIFTQFILSAVFQNTQLIKFGPLFILPFLASIAYAIFRHNLFNIRVLATESFSALIIFVFFINTFLSESSSELTFNIILFVLVTIFGILLIKGTVREIRALEELSDKKSEFLSIASHQLRTPISIIRGYLSLVREGTYGKVNSKQLEIINKVYSTNEGMRFLVEDFLNVSRAEKGTLKYNLKNFNLGDVVDIIISGMNMQAGNKELVLKWKKPKENIIIYGDKEKLQQVINNLIDNAIKYTEKGGVAVRVSVDSMLKYVRIYVSDSGIGLEEEEKEEIFSSFHRGKRGEQVDVSGAGLGLYIAKLIIEGHNGKIWAESSGENKGTTFIIELPMKKRRKRKQNAK